VLHGGSHLEHGPGPIHGGRELLLGRQDAPEQAEVPLELGRGGGYDTPFTTNPIATHGYATEGLMLILLEVQDQQGLTSTAGISARVNPVVLDTLAGEPGGEPDVDVNPLDPTNIVASGITFAPAGPLGYPSFYSQDGGASFIQSTGGDPAPTGDPNIAFDGAGRVFLSILDSSDGNGSLQGVVVSMSTNGGSSFPGAGFAMNTSTVFTFPHGRQEIPCGLEHLLFDYPKLGVEEGSNTMFISSRVNIDMDDNGGCTVGIGFVRSFDLGQTWDSPRILPDVPIGLNNIAVSSNGSVHLATANFNSPRCPTGKGILVKRSTDAGASFQAPTCAYVTPPDRAPTLPGPRFIRRIQTRSGSSTTNDRSRRPSASAHLHHTVHGRRPDLGRRGARGRCDLPERCFRSGEAHAIRFHHVLAAEAERGRAAPRPARDRCRGAGGGKRRRRASEVRLRVGPRDLVGARRRPRGCEAGAERRRGESAARAGPACPARPRATEKTEEPASPRSGRARTRKRHRARAPFVNLLDMDTKWRPSTLSP
jgi:hypothetical protein